MRAVERRRWASRATCKAGAGRFAGGLGGVGCFAALFVVILVLAPAGASAESLCTDTWTGPAEGNWTTAEDWSTGKVPASTDAACVGTGKTVRVSTSGNLTGVVQGKGAVLISAGSLEVTSGLEVSSIAGLSVVGGKLKGAAEVDVTGSFTGGLNGHLEGSGKTVIESGASGSISEYLYLANGTLVNEGVLVVSSSAGIVGNEGAAIVNSGTMTLNSESPFSGLAVEGSGPTPTFRNLGILQKTEGTGITRVAFAVDNEHTVTASLGALEFTGGGVSGLEHVGSWSASGTGKLDFDAGTYALGATASLSGSVTVSAATVTAGQIEGASLALNVLNPTCCLPGHLELTGAGISTLRSINLNDSYVKSAGQIQISETFLAGNNARLEGTGTTVIEPTAIGVIGGALYLKQQTLVNESTLSVPEAIIGVEAGVIDNRGTLTVNGEGINGLKAEGEGTNAPKLINRGILQKTEGIGTTPVYFATENYGRIIEATGRFEFVHPVALVESSSQFGGPRGLAPGQIRSSCGKPVSCATGNEYETQTDLSVGGRGVGLALSRTYNAQAGAAGEHGVFGYGWTSSFGDYLVIEKESKKATLHGADGSTVPFTEAGAGKYLAPPWTQDTLTGSPETSYTLTLASQTKYQFAGSSGRLESVTDRDGNATTLGYSAEGHLETITDPVARKITFAYNAEGLVESAKDPMGNTVKYTYEGGNLKSVTQPGELSLRWQYKYDGSHELTELTDGRGGTTINGYNGTHQVISQKDPAGHTLSFEYGPFHTRITNVTTGSVTDEYFTSNDEPSSITRGFGTASATTESFSYNEGGYVVSVTDGDGHTTTYGYNAGGDRMSVVDPNKNETKWVYDATHDVETTTTPKGETTTIKREAHGNPEVIERPAPGSKTQTTKYKYLAHGELESVTDPLEHITKYEYDAQGDRSAEIDPEGNKRTWEYDEGSREIASVSPRGNIVGGKPAEFTTKIERDKQGRPITVTDPLAHTTKYTYDGDGNVETATDGNAHKTTYTYNGDSQPIKVKEANGTVTETGYDGAGQIVSQTDGNKHKTKYARNAVEEVTEVTDPLGHKTTKEYDAAGNLKALTDPAKHTASYTYDPANRLTEVTYSDGKTPTDKYEYDADGNRAKSVDGTGTSIYTYDQLDRLTESETGHKEVSKYEYNLGNQQTKITYPNTKSVTRAFDKDGRLEKVTDWLTKITKFTYDPDSDQKTTVFPTETKDEDKYTYNDADEMIEAKMVKGAETLASLAYTRNNDNQVKKTTSKGLPGAEVTEATYDANSRLTKYGTTEYKYDAANNPTTEGTSTNTYNEGSELEKGTSATYTYNELDERTKTTPSAGPATTYGYDEAGNLTSVERPKEGETAKIEDAYAYDGNDLRSSETISATTNYLVWDMTEPLPLLLSDGANSYIYGPGGLPVEQINNTTGTVTYLHHDQAGSTRLLTGSTGTVTGKCSYAAYGTPTCEGTATTPLGYEAQYTSTDTGLIYLRHRVYDPATAQFLSVDPLEIYTGEPYSYGGDNPLNYGDPRGLAGESIGEAPSCPPGICFPFPNTKETERAIEAAKELGHEIGHGIESVWNEVTGQGESSKESTQPQSSSECGEAYTGDQDALIKIAKEAKRNGLSPEDAEVLREWADEYDVPFRGPEEHPGRPVGSQPHIHVGSQNHIPVW